MSNTIYDMECDTCRGTGLVDVLVDETITKYGEHIIGDDWTKIENVFVWFKALYKKPEWRGIPCYLYETPSGEYLAPFCGELIKVVKDTKNEYRESFSLKDNELMGGKC